MAAFRLDKSDRRVTGMKPELLPSSLQLPSARSKSWGITTLRFHSAYLSSLQAQVTLKVMHISGTIRHKVVEVHHVPAFKFE